MLNACYAIYEKIGDVELPINSFKYLINYYKSTPRYDIKKDKNTLPTIYNIINKFTILNEEQISELLYEYVPDTFEKRNLLGRLEIMIDQYGISDTVFYSFMEDVRFYNDLADKKYEAEKDKLDILEEEYGTRYVGFLKNLVVRKHIEVSKVMDNLFDSELIKEDELLARKIDYVYGSKVLPISYELTNLVLGGNDIPDDVTYVIEENKIKPSIDVKELVKTIER